MSGQSQIRNTIFRRLPLEMALAPRQVGRHRLRVVFQRADLVVLGLGVTIGAGIFSLAGQQAASTAGPAVLLAFGVAAFACLVSGLCYAELSSVLPVSGSAYTFTYVIFGEVWGWIIGWALLLELLLAVAVVARVWSQYAVATLDDFHVHLPDGWEQFAGFDARRDVLAAVVIVLLVVVVMSSTRVSLGVLWVAVIAKLAVIALVIVVGSMHVRAANYTPFLPSSRPAEPGADPTVLQSLAGQTPDVFGVLGVFTAASVVFFAFLGFDIVATTAEESRSPQRDVPRGIIQTLVLSTLLYLGVAGVLVGMRPYDQLGGAAPVSDAFRAVGADLSARLINLGALLGLTTVIIVVLIGQSRVIYSMARDGLLPAGLASVSRLGTPARATMLVAACAVVLALTAPVLLLAEMVNIGTLFAFLFVAVGVLVLRRTRPDLERGFRVSFSPLVPTLAILATSWLMINLRVVTWGYFAAWVAGGLLLYGSYGRRSSRLGRQLASQTRKRGAHRARPAVARPTRPSTHPLGAGARRLLRRSDRPKRGQ
jgi:APA family basic amino acid/polyamine antiporter